MQKVVFRSARANQPVKTPCFKLTSALIEKEALEQVICAISITSASLMAFYSMNKYEEDEKRKSKKRTDKMSRII